ncbi:MAG: hydrogenase expression/formation protein [Chromatiaceae bacterium]|jgi:hydrogenase-1 operon protein HyaF|nr:hydrogenase expression/formation protein [Chromatiaceae bacterium]
MSRLASIPISAEPIGSTPEAWDNSLPILHEIRHGLKRLAETDESTLIDLNAIPFGPNDEARLLALLGKGEVKAEVDALGPTRVWESAVHGVWIIDHRNLEEQRLALHIEITKIPDILRTQSQDIIEALRAFEARIATGPGEPDPTS